MGKITVETCEIEGLKVITPTVFGDERGYFVETYNYNDYKEAGIDQVFVQDNQSSSVKNVLRGLHFQINHPQDKLVRVLAGEVFDVAVDLRPDSATYGKWFGVLLSAENKKQFFIPKNFAHGFLVLSDYAEFAYKCTDFYHPGDEGGLKYDDPDIGVEWPLCGEALLRRAWSSSFQKRIKNGAASGNIRKAEVDVRRTDLDMRKDWIRNMESKEKAKKRFDLSRLPKPVGIGVFYGICLIVAVMVLAHNNPLAPDQHTENLKKWCACALLTLACIIFGLYYDRMFIIPRELFQSRRLIWKLAKNDFKKRYAGSYLGFLWALVQPVVTVLMYWIVFDKVFQTRAQMVASGVEVPYVLHLTAGLVPWFYFSEAITNGTNALLEYSYLVKKVVFNISILPIIKLIAATFIHVFFVAVLLVVAAFYGYYPTIYTLQVIYYSFCLFILVLAMSYCTCAVVVFFRDLAQIINIGLQVGMWVTPILWNITMINDDNVITLFKLNPLVYIVNGYRNAIYGDEWFFEHFYSSTYFWIFTVTLFCVGSLIFKRLKVHFADVL